MVRVRRPTSRISPPEPWRMLTVAASQAMRRAVSAETWMPPASSSTVWWPAAGAVDGVEDEVGGRRAHRAGPDLRARAAEGSDAAVEGSDAAVSDAGVAGHTPGHGPDVRRRRECRARPARLGVSVRIGDPSPGPCAAGVPAGTRSPRGTGPDATPPDVPAGTRPPSARGAGPDAAHSAGTRSPSARGAGPDAAPPDVLAETSRRSPSASASTCSTT